MTISHSDDASEPFFEGDDPDSGDTGPNSSPQLDLHDGAASLDKSTIMATAPLSCRAPDPLKFGSSIILEAYRTFHAQAEPTPELHRYLRHHNLDQRVIEAHAMIGAVCLCAFPFLEPGQPIFRFSSEGEPAFVITVLGDDGATVNDLVAWPLNEPDAFATYDSQMDVLGAWHMIARGGAPLHVYRNPLTWLQAGGVGCVSLNEKRMGQWLDRAGGPFVAEDLNFGRRIRNALRHRGDHHRISVPASSIRGDAA